jgi:hypothetical protein
MVWLASPGLAGRVGAASLLKEAGRCEALSVTPGCFAETRLSTERGVSVVTFAPVTNVF